jgi:hypothetical protein
VRFAICNDGARVELCPEGVGYLREILDTLEGLGPGNEWSTRTLESEGGSPSGVGTLTIAFVDSPDEG